jgi:hypothetical protein
MRRTHFYSTHGICTFSSQRNIFRQCLPMISQGIGRSSFPKPNHVSVVSKSRDSCLGQILREKGLRPIYFSIPRNPSPGVVSVACQTMNEDDTAQVRVRVCYGARVTHSTIASGGSARVLRPKSPAVEYLLSMVSNLLMCRKT